MFPPRRRLLAALDFTEIRGLDADTLGDFADGKGRIFFRESEALGPHDSPNSELVLIVCSEDYTHYSGVKVLFKPKATMRRFPTPHAGRELGAGAEKQRTSVFNSSQISECRCELAFDLP